MSSQTLPPLKQTSGKPLHNQEKKVRLVLACSLVFALLLAATARRFFSGQPLSRLECFCVLLVVTGLFVYLGDRERESPLGIEATARAIRSISIALVVALGSVPFLTGFGMLSGESLLICFCCVSQVRQKNMAASKHNQASAALDGIKRVFDVLTAGCALALLSPLLLALAAIIKIDSPGPVLFTQERVGYRGKSFRICKFRSMHTHAARYQRSPTKASDPRITRVGRWLRRLSLDELPQLFNVLRGEMSLVGPRPEMPFIAKRYSASQKQRLDAIPGLTGLWQISSARRFPIHENMNYDLYYIAHRSFSLDVAILLRTFGAVVKGIGAS